MSQEPVKKEPARGGARPGAGRPNLDKASLRVYLPKEPTQQLQALAKARAVTQSQVIHEALQQYLLHPALEPATATQGSAPPAPATTPPEPALEGLSQRTRLGLALASQQLGRSEAELIELALIRYLDLGTPEQPLPELFVII